MREAENLAFRNTWPVIVGSPLFMPRYLKCVGACMHNHLVGFVAKPVGCYLLSGPQAKPCRIV